MASGSGDFVPLPRIRLPALRQPGAVQDDVSVFHRRKEQALQLLVYCCQIAHDERKHPRLCQPRGLETFAERNAGLCIFSSVSALGHFLYNVTIACTFEHVRTSPRAPARAPGSHAALHRRGSTLIHAQPACSQRESMAAAHARPPRIRARRACDPFAAEGCVAQRPDTKATPEPRPAFLSAPSREVRASTRSIFGVEEVELTAGPSVAWSQARSSRSACSPETGSTSGGDDGQHLDEGAWQCPGARPARSPPRVAWCCVGRGRRGRGMR